MDVVVALVTSLDVMESAAQEWKKMSAESVVDSVSMKELVTVMDGS